MLRVVTRILRVCALAAALGLALAPLSIARAAGALAIGQCAAYGYAYDFSKLNDAREAALKKCADSKCSVVATMTRGCVAFAIDGRNACGPHGYAVAPRLGLAENTAVKYCHEYGGKDCVIRAWACEGGIKASDDTTGSIKHR
jgi:hypothetical protein